MKISQNLNKIISKLPKTELKVEKVELASIDTLKADSTRMQKGIEDLKRLRTQMETAYFKAIDNVNTNRGDFKQAADQLGIDPNDIKEYKNFFPLQEKLDNAYYSANK